MNKNIGNKDVIIKLLVAIALGIIVNSIIITGILAFIFMLTAVFLSFTSLFRFDTLYNFFGINTRNIKRPKQEQKQVNK